MVKAMIDSEKKQEILSAIENSGKTRGISFEEISKITGFSRFIVGKYVPVLVAEKSVTIDNCGNNKLVCLNKVPVEKRGRGSD